MNEEFKREEGEPSDRYHGAASSDKIQANRTKSTHTVFSLIFLIIGLVFLLATVPMQWLKRTVFTTNGWVDAVGPLAKQPAVQDAVVNVSVQEFTRQVDMENWISRQLPAESSGLAGLIAFLIETAVRQVTGVIVRSDAFAGIWADINRISHNVVAAGLSKGESLRSQIGNLPVDLRAIFLLLQKELKSRGIDFTLPENFTSEVAVFQSRQLPAVLDFLDTVNTFTPWIALIAIAAIAGSILFHPIRRHAVMALGIGTVITGLVLLLIYFVTRLRVTGMVPSNATFGPGAVNEIFNVITSGLVSSMLATILVGLLLWFGAFALGPSASMINIRNNIRTWIHSLGKNRRPGSAELWVGAHRYALQIWVLIAAAITLIFLPQRTLPYVVILAFAVMLLEFVVEYLGREIPAYQVSR